MKKLLCAFLALTLFALPILALSAGAESSEDSIEGNFRYSIYDGIAYLSGYVGTDERVVIPATLGGAPVTVISHFGPNENVTAVILPDTVKQIAPHAFVNCTALSEVLLPEGLLSIETAAFGGCESLKSIHIPSTVSQIGYSVFGLTGLTEITVDEDNPYLYAAGNCLIERGTEKLLQGCSTSVIPEGVKTIGNSAFSGAGLTEIVIPDSVKTIEENAFWGETELTGVTLGSGVKTIGSEAFSVCRSLTSIRIPASVTTVGEKAFDFCVELKDVYCDLPFRLGGWNENWLGNCNAAVHWNEDAAMRGDLNANGSIDSADYLMLKRYCLHTFQLTEGQKTVADINGDKKINGIDYLLVKRHTLKTFVIS